MIAVYAEPISPLFFFAAFLSSWATPVQLIFLILSLCASHQKKVSKALLHLRFVAAVSLIRLGELIYNLFHCIHSEGMGVAEATRQNILLVAWHILITCVLLMIGFLWCWFRNLDRTFWMGHWLSMIAVPVLFFYMLLLVIGGTL